MSRALARLGGLFVRSLPTPTISNATNGADDFFGARTFTVLDTGNHPFPPHGEPIQVDLTGHFKVH